MFKLFLNTIFIFLLVCANSYNESFEQWLKKFRRGHRKRNFKKVVVEIMSNAKFLPKVITVIVINQNFTKIPLHILKKIIKRKIKEGLN